MDGNFCVTLGGVLEATFGLDNENFRMEFAFDDTTKKAVLIGNQGVADVELHSGNHGVTSWNDCREGSYRRPR